MSLHGERCRDVARAVDSVEAELVRLQSRLWAVRQTLQAAAGAKIGHQYDEDPPAVLVRFVNAKGQEVPRDRLGAIEIRCAGAGWRWMDTDGREWGSAGAPLDGEPMPRWVVRGRLKEDE